MLFRKNRLLKIWSGADNKRLAAAICLCLIAAAALITESFGNYCSQMPKVFYDTGDYAAAAKLPLLSGEFWFCWRSPGYPLLLKAFGDNYSAVSMFQTIFCCTCWLFLAAVMWSVGRSLLFRAIGCLSVIAFALLPEIQLWNSLIITESIFLSSLALLTGLYLIYMQHPSRRIMASIILISIWLITVKDVYAYAFLILIAFLAAAAVFSRFQKNRATHAWITLGLFFLLPSILSIHNQNANLRWYSPLLNVIGKRFLPDEKRVADLRNMGAPIDDALLDSADKYSTQLSISEDFKNWMLSKGKSAYAFYLLTHPGYTIPEIRKHSDTIFAFSNGNIAYFYGSSPQLVNRFTHYRLPNRFCIIFSLVCFVSLFAGSCLNRNFVVSSMVPLIMGVIGFVLACLSYFGDSMDMERHCIVPAIQMYLGMMLAAIFMADSQWLKFRGRILAGWKHAREHYLPLLVNFLFPPVEKEDRLDTYPSYPSSSPENSHGSRIDPAATLTWWTYLAFSLMLIYVFLVMITININDSLLRLIIVGFIGLFFLAWKYRFNTIGRALNNVRLSHILLLAVAIRLAWVLTSGVEQTTDFAGYDADAWQIANGEKWFSILRPAGAPIFFAVQYWIFGHITLIPQISLALLSTLQIYLVYDISSRTLADKNAGKIAAAVMTLWPEHIIYNNLLCTEVPFTTLVLLSVWLLWSDTRGYTWRVLLAGICLGTANWVRPNAPIIFAAMLAFLLLRKQGPLSIWNRGRAALAGLAGFAVMIAPIAYLNYQDNGSISLIPTKRSGYNLMYGTNLVSHGNYYDPDNNLVDAEALRRGGRPGMESYIFRDQIAGEIGLARLKEQPLKILRMAVCRKIPNLWGNPATLIWSFETSRFKDYYYRVYLAAMIYNVIILCLSGWAVLRRRKLFAILDERWIYVAAVLLATLSHVILEVQPRYHHAFLPVFAMCIGAFARPLHIAETVKITRCSSAELEESAIDTRQQAA